jgi:hypothetical protein
MNKKFEVTINPNLKQTDGSLPTIKQWVVGRDNTTVSVLWGDRCYFLALEPSPRLSVWTTDANGELDELLNEVEIDYNDDI